MKLSVIVPCFNAAATLADQLQALANQHWDQPWEIIVADNGSTDDSISVVKHHQRRMRNLRLVNAGSQPGAAHARNRGAWAAHGQWLAFCDADDVVGEGWLAAMGEALSKHDFVACRHDYQRLNAADLLKSRGAPQQDGPQEYRRPPYLPHAGGCGLGIRRKLHEAVGGFDESLPQLEDTDYCWRIQLAGIPLHFAGEAVMHIRLRNAGGIFRQARNYGKYNIVLYKRYRPHGMPRLSWTHDARKWRSLIKRVPNLWRREARLTWLWLLGWEIGRLQGFMQRQAIPSETVHVRHLRDFLHAIHLMPMWLERMFGIRHSGRHP